MFLALAILYPNDRLSGFAMATNSLALPTLSLFWSWGKGLAQSHRPICSENHPEVRESHTMNFINEHVSSNFYSRQLVFAICKGC